MFTCNLQLCFFCDDSPPFTPPDTTFINKIMHIHRQNPITNIYKSGGKALSSTFHEITNMNVIPGKKHPVVQQLAQL